MKVIIQARTASTRLPGKVLKPFWQQKTLLDILIEKLQMVFRNEDIILATSISQDDKVLIRKAEEHAIKSFAGSEHDVQNRFIECAREYHASKIIRICSDNPFLDISLLRELIEISEKNRNYDYWSYKDINGIPVIKTHLGLFGEIVTLDALEQAYSRTSDPLYKEHVTNFIYAPGNNFKVFLQPLTHHLIQRGDFRFTIDDHIDFDNLQELYNWYMVNNEDLSSLIQYIDKSPELKQKMTDNIDKYTK